MSKRTRTAVAAAGVAALALWGVATLAASRGEPSPAREADALARLLRGATPGAVLAVHVTVPGGDAVRLARDGSHWTVNGHPADSAAVAEFWYQVEEARVAGVATRAWEDHPDLGVVREDALIVVFEHARAADTLLVGNEAEEGGFFARLPGQRGAYRVLGDLRPHVLREADAWRSLHVLTLDTAAVASVAIEREGEVYTLARGEDGWRVDGHAADEATLRLLLRELASLDASGFPERAFAAAFAEPERTVTIRDVRGDVLATLELREAEARWIVRRGDHASVWVVPSWRAERLTPHRNRLERHG